MNYSDLHYADLSDEPIQLPMRSWWPLALGTGALAAAIGFGLAKMAVPVQLQVPATPVVAGEHSTIEVTPLPLKSTPAAAPAETERPKPEAPGAAAHPVNASVPAESGTPVDEVMLRIRTYRDGEGNVIRRETTVMP